MGGTGSGRPREGKGGTRESFTSLRTFQKSTMETFAIFAIPKSVEATLLFFRVSKNLSSA